MGGLRGGGVAALLKDDSLIQDLAKALVAELEAVDDHAESTLLMSVFEVGLIPLFGKVPS